MFIFGQKFISFCFPFLKTRQPIQPYYRIAKKYYFFCWPFDITKSPKIFISFSVGLFSSLRNRAVEWTSKSYLSVHIDVLQCHFLLLNICQRNLREKKLATLCHYHRNKPSQTFGHVCHQINTRMDKSEL